jgi:hypothetical protein
MDLFLFIEATEGLRARYDLGFPTGLAESIDLGDDAVFLGPNRVRQGKVEVSVLPRPGEIGASSILIGELPQSFGAEISIPPQNPDRPGDFLVPPVPCVFAVWGVGQQDIIVPPRKKGQDGVLHHRGRQGNLVRAIVQIPHGALRTQALQSPQEFWSPVRIFAATKGHNER